MTAAETTKPPRVPGFALRWLERMGPLAPAEQERLARMLARRQAFAPPGDLISEGEGCQRLLLLESGWCYRWRVLSDGRRQLLGVALPGDLVGLRPALFGIEDYSLAAQTAVMARVFAVSELIDAFGSHPRLTALFAAMQAQEEAILAQHVVRLGRMDAYERMAHLFLELNQRLMAMEIASQDHFQLPMTQELLADLLGITVVHVNRTLRRLREDRLVTVEHGRAVLHDRDRLARVCQFDPAYLGPRYAAGSTPPAKTRLPRP